MITCCSGFASIQFSQCDDGKRLNPRTSKSFFAICCTVVAKCQFGSDMVLLTGKGQLPIFSFCAGYGDGSFLILCRSLHRPTPVRCNWSVFARKMRSTTKFAMTILSKCVCVCVKFSSSTPLIFVCLILNADSIHRCFCCLCELPLDRVGPRQGVREKATPYPNNKKQQKNKVRPRLLAQSSDFPFRSGSFPRSFLALRKWLLNFFGNHRKSSSSDLA